MQQQKRPEFEWRAPMGAWRWLILGSIGVAPYACGGRTDPLDPEGQAGSISNGGSAGIGGTGASGGVGGSPGIYYGTAGVAGYAAGGAAGAYGGYAGSYGGYAGSIGFSGSAGDAGSAGSASLPSGCYADGVAQSGFQGCTNGMQHRVSVETCASQLPRATTGLPEEYRALADAGQYQCFHDEDCTENAYGHCELGQGGPYCVYGCVTDSDCDTGQLCLCDTPVGRCVATNCQTDDDCGYGLLCGTSASCSVTSFACQTSLDECAVNSDCSTGLCQLTTLGGYGTDLAAPAPGPRQRRECRPYNCPVPGRPFLVEGEVRLAACAARSDWYSEVSLAVGAAPGPELRQAIVDGWTAQALMEHASVAAFARFTLQLLALGAPAELVTGAADAMQDEIRHARDCFSLARRYSETHLGPGPLPVERALDQIELADVVLTTVREGCIGETVAALEAAEAWHHCEDPAAKAVLERIAAEETRHAELAWRFVAWALEHGSSELSERVEAEFAEALQSVEPANPPLLDFDHQLSRHGLLSAPLRQALRQRVLQEAVAPCARALLERVSAPRPALETAARTSIRPASFHPGA